MLTLFNRQYIKSKHILSAYIRVDRQISIYIYFSAQQSTVKLLNERKKVGSSAGEKCQKKKKKKKTGWISAFPLLVCAEVVTMLMLCSSKQGLKIKHSDYQVQEADKSCHVVC